MKREDAKYNLILVILLCVQVCLICFFGVQKAGFHQDEYYSYFSSNRSLGFYYPDREWVDTATILDEFMVKRGEGFQYALVSTVQSWDVHPPLFYDLLHTVCSLTPGIFSKWQGLIVNLTAFVLSFFLLYSLSGSIGMKKDLRLVVMAAYGFHPMTVSCVMFIRMYMWLTVFVLAASICHMRLISLVKEHYMGLDCGMGALDEEKSKHFFRIFLKNFAILMITNFLGFLTQYYYLIFIVMIGVFFCLWFLALIPVKKAARAFFESEKYRIGIADRLKYVVLYVVGSAASLGAAIIVYPAAASHIFRGYRGQEAAQAFTDNSNILERIGFFLGLAGKYLFSDIWEIVALLVVLAIIALSFFIKIKGEKDRLHIAHVRILAISTIMYFLIVAKTALLLGNTSNRYEMPIYPLAILLLIYFVRVGFRAMIGNRSVGRINLAVALTFLLFTAIDIKGLAVDDNVLFLYREDGARIAYASDMKEKGAKTLVMYNEATPDNIWRLADELLTYDTLYYVNESNTVPIADEEILKANTLVVYAADHENRDALIDMIMKVNPRLTKCEKVSTKDMWTLYVFGS